ncbi:MAG: metallophosphoesterase [Bacteroidales bacterium]
MKIALITDIHEDIVSLKKALKMIEIEKCDHIICLGDILGYPFMRGSYSDTRNASECINLIKKNCSAVLLGNHDIFHLQKFPDFSDGYDFPSDWYYLSPNEKTTVSANRVWNYTDDYPVQLNEKDAGYLFSLPEFIIKEFNDRKIIFSHYLFPNFTGYVSNDKNEQKRIRDHFKYINESGCQLSIVGHMHIEGTGICYEPVETILSQLFNGFTYYSFGERRLKSKLCCITVPALTDSSQVNGFAIFDSNNYTINALSLNTNRRFIL